MVKMHYHLARILLILGVAIVGGSGAAPVGASTSEVTSQGRRDNSSERCKPDTVCSEKDLHGVQICGTNGKTYANPCELRVAACLGVPVQMHGMGECLLSERCRLERDFQLARIEENATLYVNEFIPECDATSGLYTSIQVCLLATQCHMAIGYCWCSTIKGIAISGTSVSIDSGDRPDCTAHEYRSLSPIHVDATGSITHPEDDDTKGTAASDCSAADRIQFNSGLLEVFGKAYLNAFKNANDTETTEEPTDANAVTIDNEVNPKKPNDVTQKQLIVWKFAQLDTDNNGRLTPAELESEHRLTLRIVGPKACGHGFADYCDKNSDKLIDLQEWTNCLNSELGPAIRYRSHIDLSNLGPPRLTLSMKKPPFTIGGGGASGTDRTTGTPGCAAERDKLQRETDKAYLATMFVPSCSRTDNRLYEQMQCHLKVGQRLCWCVDAVTGTPSDSGLVNSADECVAVTSRAKQTPVKIKGCVSSQELIFYRRLFSLFSREMRKESKPAAGEKRRKPAVAKWKFAQLDANHDGVIEKAEWKDLRTKARSLKDVRKCGRNFLRSCDRDKDRKITKKEWMACTVHAYKHAKSNQANPFLTLLKPLD